MPTPTPMSEVLREAIKPAYRLLPAKMDSDAATVLLLAFGAQESRFEYTDQVDRHGADVLGPALGWWQFERGGGVVGVMNHPSTARLSAALAEACGVVFSPTAMWKHLKVDQVFAAGMARLLIYTDPHALPQAMDEEGAFDLYVRTWRPGAYWGGTDDARRKLREKFGRNHQAALAAGQVAG